MFIAAQYVQAPRSSGVQCGIDGGTQEAMPLAPEGRHVYSSTIRPSPALQRSAMWYRWWNTGSDPFSPRGATCRSVIREGNLTQKRRENGKVEPVGVGFPNPLGEETSPLRLATY